jgi:acetylornithine/N-succinyldiaminopimelate aminotransferase
VRATGDYLSQQLSALSARLGLGAERGIGLLRALELGHDRGGDVVVAARDRLAEAPGWANEGLLLNSPRPSLLRFMPALTTSRAEIDRMIDGLAVTLERL